MSEKKFYEEEISSWKKLIDFFQKLNGLWIYRGQYGNWPLSTGLERACEEFEFLKYAPQIEYQLIREFRRRYRGSDFQLVINNTAYCLALMQHHGAPTRLLDCTYSPFVATYFALESKHENPPSVVYCFNVDNLEKGIKQKEATDLINKRSKDDNSRKDDKIFQKLYMNKKKLNKFVCAENPLYLNERLIIQKGVFLCPGKVSESFFTNLKEIKGWGEKNCIIKVKIKFDLKDRINALDQLHNMNVDRATLFPGLDGFTESLRPRLPYFKKLNWKGSGIWNKEVNIVRVKE